MWQTMMGLAAYRATTTPQHERRHQLCRRRRLAIELLEARHLLTSFYDFGPLNSQVASGFQLVTDTDPMWQPGADDLGSLVRNSGDALERDIVYLKSGTLSVTVPDGAYNVTVHAGDMLYSHQQMTVTIEGTQYDLPDTVAGQVIAATYQNIMVSDGALTMFFHDLGGPNAYVALAGLEIVDSVPPWPALSVSIVDDSIAEDRTTTATVSREGTVGDLVVPLSNNKPDEATAPVQVTIPDGQTTSAPFTIAGQLDRVDDSDETVTITAWAKGFTSGSDSLVVTNVFEAHYDFSPSLC